MTSTKLQAGAIFPKITLSKLGGGSVELGKPSEGHDWKLVVIYRGAHCPICTRYLGEINELMPELSKLGIDVVAASADPEDRANEQIQKVNPLFPVGYDLSVAQMQKLSLYMSGPRPGTSVDRPFAEPGLFVVNEKGEVQIMDTSNVPFARPDLKSLMRGLNYIKNLEGGYALSGAYVA